MFCFIFSLKYFNPPSNLSCNASAKATTDSPSPACINCVPAPVARPPQPISPARSGLPSTALRKERGSPNSSRDFNTKSLAPPDFPLSVQPVSMAPPATLPPINKDVPAKAEPVKKSLLFILIRYTLIILHSAPMDFKNS